MAFEPSELTYDAAKKFLSGRTRVTPFEKSIISVIEAEDYWQRGARYVGPLPPQGPGFAAAMMVLQKSFAPLGKLRECLRRHVRGVVGREPQFELVLPDAASKAERRKRALQNAKQTLVGAEALADAADEVQGSVFDAKKELKLIQRFTGRLCATTQAYLRFDIPPGYVVEGEDAAGNLVEGIEAATWQDAYKLFHVELVAPGAAFIHLDAGTLKKTAFYAYADIPNANKPTQKRRCIQISYLDNESITQVRVVRDDGSIDEWELDTGGHLLVIEADRNALITPALQQMEDIGSSIGTMVKVNTDVAGFPQQSNIDMEEAGEDVEDPATGKTKFVPKPLPTGPRKVQSLYSYVDTDSSGKVKEDDNGKPVIRQGRIEFRNPVDSTSLRADADWFVLEIYRGVNQSHIPARTSANAAAAMLVELRSDYADSLMETQPEVEGALRELFHARLCAAAYLAGDTKTLAQFKVGRVRVDCDLNAGPLSTEEATEIRAQIAAGLLSEQTGMIMLGIKDVDAEKMQMQEEAREKMGDGFSPVPAASLSTEVQDA